MIISASRRTDIPNYYSDWFYKRVEEGFLHIRNPFNPHQVSNIDLSTDKVDCIVFWTKNPENMLLGLDTIVNYNYYFQFTLTGYGRDIEPGLPDKRGNLIKVFQKLSDRIGHDRVVWRYDPIFLNERYTVDYHIKAFNEIARNLKGYTDEVIISFMDIYPKMKRNSIIYDMKVPSEDEMMIMAYKMAESSVKNSITIKSCAERFNLSDAGIIHGSCIDKEKIEKIVGHSIKISRDKNQREECQCIKSIDVGTYDTCMNYCRYCYAVRGEKAVIEKNSLYDINSPLLCGVESEKKI